MSFDALFTIQSVLVAVALLRLRPATFIIAASHLSTLRALTLIAAHGQPRSQQFLPASVFRSDKLEVAAWLFTLQALLLAVALALPDSRTTEGRVHPAVPRWLLGLLGLVFLAIALSSRTILTHEYTDVERTIFGFNLGGAGALLFSVALYELVRQVQSGARRPAVAFLLLTLIFTATDFLKGSTGFATGYLVAGALFFFRHEPAPLRRWASLAAALLFAVSLALVVRGVRTSLYAEGTAAVSGFAATVGDAEAQAARRAEGLEGFGNGTQYAAHLLACVSLYEAGVSREWRSIYSPLEYTFKPSFLVDRLGLSRSREAAWELGDYYIHGGGIFVLGELYWNGGYLCTAVVLSALLLFAWRCDTAWRLSFPWLMLACAFTPSLLQGIGYGFAQVARGAINGLLCLLVWKGWGLVARARRAPAAAAGARA